MFGLSDLQILLLSIKLVEIGLGFFFLRWLNAVINKVGKKKL